MKSKRLELQEYYGQDVKIKGRIAKISAQRGIHIDRKTLLLKNVEIYTLNAVLKYDHMWFTVRSDEKYRVNQIIKGMGTVSCYQRRNTAYDYTIKLTDICSPA